jgi:hypothetical protein
LVGEGRTGRPTKEEETMSPQPSDQSKIATGRRRSTLRLSCLTLLSIAGAAAAGSSALACPAAPGPGADTAASGQRATQQSTLPHHSSRNVGSRTLCTSVYPLSCRALTRSSRQP